MFRFGPKFPGFFVTQKSAQLKSYLALPGMTHIKLKKV